MTTVLVLNLLKYTTCEDRVPDTVHVLAPRGLLESGKPHECDSGGVSAYPRAATAPTDHRHRLAVHLLLPSSYTADAYLFLNTAKELDYNQHSEQLEA